MRAIKNYKEWKMILEQGGEVPYVSAPWHSISGEAPESPEGWTGDYDITQTVVNVPNLDNVPEDDKYIAEKFRKLLRSEVALKSLKKRINQVVDSEVNKKYNQDPSKPKIPIIDIQAEVNKYFTTGDGKNTPDAKVYAQAIAKSLGDPIKISYWLGGAKVNSINPNESDPLNGTILGSLNLSITITNSEIEKIAKGGLKIRVSISASLIYKISEDQLASDNLLMTWKISNVSVNGSGTVDSGPFTGNPLALKISNGKMNLTWKYGGNTLISLIKDQDLKINSYIPQKSGEVDLKEDLKLV